MGGMPPTLDSPPLYIVYAYIGSKNFVEKISFRLQNERARHTRNETYIRYEQYYIIR